MQHNNLSSVRESEHDSLRVSVSALCKIPSLFHRKGVSVVFCYRFREIRSKIGEDGEKILPPSHQLSNTAP
jgi:hypothetical protein